MENFTKQVNKITQSFLLKMKRIFRFNFFNWSLMLKKLKATLTWQVPYLY